MYIKIDVLFKYWSLRLYSVHKKHIRVFRALDYRVFERNEKI